MAQVKETIDLLTKVLRGNGTSKIKAETFRLAKFDKDEAVVPLWRLLFELLYFLEHGVIDEVAVKACSELTTEEQVVYVKQEIQQRGFYSSDFSHLPNDMSKGSRELLLALAWLLCTEGVIDKFMDKCASPMDSDMYDFPSVKYETLFSPSESFNAPAGSLSPVQKIQQLQLLNGKLRLSLKRLYSVQRERMRLQHKVHESTQGVSLLPEVQHLSVIEVQLLRHPDYMKKMLKLLEKDNNRLQNMLNWRDQEEFFWKWMESVLDLKMKDSLASEETSAKKPMIHYNIPPDLVGRMNQARKQLEAAILKYEPIIEQLEELWETKREEIKETELDSLLSDINKEIELHRSNLLSDMKPTIGMNELREPRFVLEKKLPNKKSSNIQQRLSDSRIHVSPSTDHQSGVLAEPTDIQTEMFVLESHIQRLEEEARRKECNYRSQLDSLAAQIPESVCIQPMSLH